MLENEKNITNIDLSKVTDDGLLPETKLSEEEVREYESIFKVKKGEFDGLTMTEAQILMMRNLQTKFPSQKQQRKVIKAFKKAKNKYKKLKEVGESSEDCIKEKSTE